MVSNGVRSRMVCDRTRTRVRVSLSGLTCQDGERKPSHILKYRLSNCMRPNSPMASPKLDALVKGAPTSSQIPAAASALTSQPKIPSITQTPISTQVDPSDPTSLLPSSPPQIYLNLLILEASLRAQYLTLRSRRRQYTFFVTLLLAWNVYFGYNLFLRTREDGLGVGGSVYWMVELGQKMALMAGMLTGVLLWGTGQWERGLRWPRRWIGVANRGLRGFNVKIVVVKRGWVREGVELVWLIGSMLVSPRNGGATGFRYMETESSVGSRGSRKVQDEEMVGADEEDLEPGGDYVKLLLLPKSFSPEFREAWEVYRSDYWEKENERRAQVKIKLRKAEKEASRRNRGRFWWLSLGARKEPQAVLQRPPGLRSRRSSTISQKSSRQHLLLQPGDEKVRRHRYSTSSRSDSQSRTSSRNSTPGSELDANEKGRSEAGSSRRVTRSSKRSRIPGMTSPEEEKSKTKRYSLRGSHDDNYDRRPGTPPADESLEASIRMASPITPGF